MGGIFIEVSTLVYSTGLDMPLYSIWGIIEGHLRISLITHHLMAIILKNCT